MFRLFLFGVGLLPVSIFLATDGLSRHVAWIVMERSFLFFARLFLVGILVIGHGITPGNYRRGLVSIPRDGCLPLEADWRLQALDNASSDRSFGGQYVGWHLRQYADLIRVPPLSACQFIEGSVGKESRSPWSTRRRITVASARLTSSLSLIRAEKH